MPKANYENVLYEVQDYCAWITVNRPDKLNALDRATMTEIAAAAAEALADDDVAVLVLTGAGEKAFVAGADIKEMSAMSAAEAQEFSEFLQSSLEILERSPKPVVAAVNGFALGGGCELAMACHVRLASDRAKFGQPEVNLGLIPGAGGTQRLQRIVGRGRALDLILSGDMIDAAEAHRIGLVNRIFPDDGLREGVEAYAKTLRKKSPIALARAIEAIVAGGEISQDEAMRLEAALFGLCFATEDMSEGTKAFLEKRKASFSGR
jgi:enoyl-CoA hydratase/carnithine racemase